MSSDTYTVERSTKIDAPRERIYEQLADFRNWLNWSPWEGMDPAMKRTYSGADAGSGASYAWSGNRKAGQGRMLITDAREPSRVQIALTFEKPFKSRSQTVFDIQPDGAQSVVTWTMIGEQTLMTRVMGIFTSMDKMIGPDFDKGLSQLKATTEQSTVD